MPSRVLASMAAAATVLAGCASPSPSPAPSATPNGRTVSTQLQFTAKTVGGAEFSGQTLVGRPAVLWFWAPWCPVCQGEAPAVGQIAAAHSSVTFVGVAGLDRLSAMQGFLARYPVNGFTELADIDGAVWTRFGVTRQPAYAFIRGDGAIDVVRGPLSGPALTQRVSALFPS